VSCSSGLHPPTSPSRTSTCTCEHSAVRLDRSGTFACSLFDAQRTASACLVAGARPPLASPARMFLAFFISRPDQIKKKSGTCNSATTPVLNTTAAAGQRKTPPRMQRRSALSCA